jgi:non-ribosomal peptide synthase protein (TIGR01720 family)
LAGEGLARGYWNRAEMTAERFVWEENSKFKIQNSKFKVHGLENDGLVRLYRTGDLVRFLVDGNLEYHGRMDGQVKLRGFRIELGEIEAVLNQHPDVEQAIAQIYTAPSNETSVAPQLIAYYVSGAGADGDGDLLAEYLRQLLPSHMLPTALIPLSAFPLTPNGKIDRRALPAPSRLPEVVFQPAQTLIQQQLVEIWQRVLDRESIGIEDNFFELGGDSILAMQVIAQANQTGLKLLPRQLFQAQTIASLAMQVNQVTPTVAPQGLVIGDVPLTPIQHWFFAQNFAVPNHWNQSVLLEVPPLDPHIIETALWHLLRHHDALRLRFSNGSTPDVSTSDVSTSDTSLVNAADKPTTIAHQQGQWRQFHADPEAIAIPLTVFDFTDLSADQQQQAIASTANALQGSLDLSSVLMRVALMQCGIQGDRLLIILHHLIIDGVSWRILLEDLQMLYTQLSHKLNQKSSHNLSQNQSPQLPPKTTAFQQWAIALQERAQANTQDQTSDWHYWTTPQYQQSSPIPTDDPHAANRVADLATYRVALTATETQTLLQETAAAYQTQINDLLLTALAQTLADWTGSSQVLIELEGHGREALREDAQQEMERLDISQSQSQNLADADLSRSIGWFTTLFPVWLNLESSWDLGRTIKAVKEQLRSLPKRGLSYGLCRYLTDASTDYNWADSPQPQVRFNYLGQIDQVLSPPFALAKESAGATRHPLNHRDVLLEFNAMTVAGQMQFTWGYSHAIHRSSAIANLAEQYIVRLRALIQHCQSPDAGGYTPSDFPLMAIDQADLDTLLADLSG